METNMIPSELSEDVLISRGQIAQLTERVETALLKFNRTNQGKILLKEPFQMVLGEKGTKTLVDEIVNIITKRIDMKSDFLAFHVMVDRTISPKEALVRYAKFSRNGMSRVDERLITEVSIRNERGTEEVFLFRFVHETDKWEKEYEIRGLKPADVYTMAAVNGTVFLPENITRWMGKDGKWTYCFFRALAGCSNAREPFVEQRFYNNCTNGELSTGWWHVGVRK